jgi:protein pelota
MRVIYKDLRKGELKVRAENLDDLWVLSSVVEPGDMVSGRTVRKIKLGGEEEKSESFKKEVFLSIVAETVEFQKYGNILRISGKNLTGTDEIPAGAYHTFNVTEGTEIAVQKKEWLNFQLERIEEAGESQPKILICIFEREEAVFYIPRAQGYEKILELKGEVEKKQMKSAAKDFYSEIKKALVAYNEKLAPEKIIIASPAFWKEYLSKMMTEPNLKGKIVYSTVSSADATAVSELMRRPELQNVLKADRVSKEETLVSELFEKIAKGSLAEYGLSEVKSAVESGAVEKLFVSDALIQESRQKGTYPEIESIMKTAEKMKGKVFIISSENSPGQKLMGISGIAATLRYPIKF